MTPAQWRWWAKEEPGEKPLQGNTVGIRRGDFGNHRSCIIGMQLREPKLAFSILNVCICKLSKARTGALSLIYLHQDIVSTGHDMGRPQINMPDPNPPCPGGVVLGQGIPGAVWVCLVVCGMSQTAQLAWPRVGEQGFCWLFYLDGHSLKALHVSLKAAQGRRLTPFW